MKISGRLLAALAAASVASHGFADVFEVEIGSFRFGAGTDDYEYVGDATPWPSAIRVTIRVHDRAGRLTGGRQAQFVINLPKA